jgi:hypothetical protein
LPTACTAELSAVPEWVSTLAHPQQRRRDAESRALGVRLELFSLVSDPEAFAARVAQRDARWPTQVLEVQARMLAGTDAAVSDREQNRGRAGEAPQPCDSGSDGVVIELRPRRSRYPPRAIRSRPAMTDARRRHVRIETTRAARP